MKKIKLSQNQYALVDNEDFEWLNQWKWSYNFGGYALRKINNQAIYMHRLVMSTPKGMCTDHINHNGLDNRKENLRICTKAQNQYNTIFKSPNGYRGITWQKTNKKWVAQINYKNKCIYIGSFTNIRHAAMAYDIWAIDIRKKFSVTNFKAIAH